MIREWVKELWDYKELFYFFALRDIKLRYRQTFLGISWAVIQPLVTMVVFTILFGKIAKIPTDGVPHPPFYISAILPWNYFVTVITQSGNSLVSNPRLLTKVYFPRVILPASSVLTAFLDFSIGVIILAGVMAYYDMAFSWRILLLPIVMIPMMFLTLGVGMFLAALNVRYRDVKFAIPFFIQVMFFLTPVFYPSSAIPDKYRSFIFLNPISGIIESIRLLCFPGRDINLESIGISFAFIVVVFSIGLFYFIRTEAEFSDII